MEAESKLIFVCTECETVASGNRIRNHHSTRKDEIESMDEGETVEGPGCTCGNGEYRAERRDRFW